MKNGLNMLLHRMLGGSSGVPGILGDGAAVGCGISGTGSGFRVGGRTSGGV